MQAKRPKYQRVREYLLGQFASGSLRTGDRLPTEKKMVDLLGVGRHSVREALNRLTADGIIERVQGKGTFVRNTEQPGPVRKKLDAFALVLLDVYSTLYPDLVRGFGQAAAAAGHQVIFCETHNDIHIQSDAILQLIDKNVAGVAIVPVTKSAPAYQLRQLHAHQIPVVFCHRRADNIQAPLITWQWEEVPRMAVDALVEQGHRRIVFLSMGSYVVSDAYLRGFRAALATHGIEPRDDQVHYFNQEPVLPSDLEVRRALECVLNRPNPPTAIFTNGTAVSEQIYVQAMDLGLRIPQDFSLIAFGPRPGGRSKGSLHDRMAAVTADVVQVGRQAVGLLDEMRAGRQPLESNRQVVMPLELFRGQSLGPPRESSASPMWASAQEGDDQQIPSGAYEEEGEVPSLKD